MYEFHIRKKKQINFLDKQGVCIDLKWEMYTSWVIECTGRHILVLATATVMGTSAILFFKSTVIRFYGIF